MTAPLATLFVVATPIGNLEDITLRALRVLREADLVAAEDTRRSGNLLRHYGIGTPLISLHAHNEAERVRLILDRLAAGARVALVSDAGSPGISDPGALLVATARAAGHRIEPIPGASAVTSILSVCGADASRFAFAAFPPVRGRDRNEWFDWVSYLAGVPVIAFEAPHRIARTLRDCGRTLGERPILLGREMTKAHEEWLLIPDPALAIPAVAEKGEFTLCILPALRSSTAQPELADSEIAAQFGQTTGVASRREAIRLVADRTGLSAKAVFEALERAKNTIR